MDIKFTEEFLWSKIQRVLDYWEANGEYSSIGRVYRGPQIYETEQGNLNFIIYNLRGFLSGHFLFTVNPDTFEYAIQMHSNYGALLGLLLRPRTPYTLRIVFPRMSV